MARIVLADDGIPFDGDSPNRGPLGGAESAVIDLTRALAARGHEMRVVNKCTAARTIDGVSWGPLAAGMPDGADLYIANRGDKLIPLMPQAGRTIFWIHNPARYILKWRYLTKLWRVRPVIVFIGRYHATTYPAWAPDGGRQIIPYGVGVDFIGSTKAEAPPPRAIFTSNPLRSLDWLLDLWRSQIRPEVPDAELHIYSGPGTYGAVGDAKSAEMTRVLDQARALADHGVFVHEPVAKSRLSDVLRDSRVMLYKGDVNETFCAAVAEAQAAGVPAVVGRLGSVVERVIDGETGAIADDDREFARAAVSLLKDDEMWRRQHQAAVAQQRNWNWDEAACAFERLIPQ